MDERVMRALHHVGHHFECFSRNGRWGTCVDCPRTAQGVVYPEFCKNTERYDHQLKVEALAEQFNFRLRTP